MFELAMQKEHYRIFEEPMIIFSAIREGLRRVTASPKLILFLWLFNFVMALPLTLLMSGQIESSLGASLVSEKMQKSFDLDWYEEFNHSAGALGKTFSPAVIGVGPFLGNLESWLTGSLFANYAGIVGLGLGYMIIWMFLLGGILDRFAHREERLTMERFFSASGRYFLRFVTLAVLSGVLYFLVCGFIAPQLFALIAESTRDTTVEKTVFFMTAGAYLVVAFLLMLINMIFEYAKIATVVHDQRNGFAAVLNGVQFVFSHPAKTFGLYLALGVFLLVGLGVYSIVAPGANQSSVINITLTFLLGQIFLVMKLIMRLTFFGGQMALYETMTERMEPAPATV